MNPARKNYERAVGEVESILESGSFLFFQI